MAVWIAWARVLVVGDYLSPVEIPMISDGGSRERVPGDARAPARRSSSRPTRSSRGTARRSTASVRWRSCARISSTWRTGRCRSRGVTPSSGGSTRPTGSASGDDPARDARGARRTWTPRFASGRCWAWRRSIRRPGCASASAGCRSVTPRSTWRPPPIPVVAVVGHIAIVCERLRRSDRRDCVADGPRGAAADRVLGLAANDRQFAGGPPRRTDGLQAVGALRAG